MNVYQIILAVWLIGAGALSPLTLKLARKQFEKELQSGKMMPGTEWAVLLTTQFVTAAIWPIVVPVWLYEFATQRARRQR